jgi:hypothetical protein
MRVVDERLAVIDDGVAAYPERQRSVVHPVRTFSKAVSVDTPVVEREDVRGRAQHAYAVHRAIVQSPVSRPALVPLRSTRTTSCSRRVVTPPRVITSRRSARPAAAGADARATGCTRLPLSILRAHEGDVTGAACTGHLDGEAASTKTNSNPSRSEQPAGRNKPVEGGREKPVEGGELDASHSPEGRGTALVLAVPNGTASPRSSRLSGRRPRPCRSVGRAGTRGRWQGRLVGSTLCLPGQRQIEGWIPMLLPACCCASARSSS